MSAGVPLIVHGLLETDPAQLELLVAEHNNKIGAANEAQMAVVKSFTAKRDSLAQERDRLVQAIALGGASVALLVKEVEKRQVQIGALAKRIEAAEAAVQPVLTPKRSVVADYLAGSASIFEGDRVRDRESLGRIVDAILIYQDGAIVVRFRDGGLFGPVTMAWVGPAVPASTIADGRQAHAEAHARLRQHSRHTDHVHLTANESTRPVYVSRRLGDAWAADEGQPLDPGVLPAVAGTGTAPGLHSEPRAPTTVCDPTGT